jgi:hypothetical protein
LVRRVGVLQAQFNLLHQPALLPRLPAAGQVGAVVGVQAGQQAGPLGVDPGPGAAEHGFAGRVDVGHAASDGVVRELHVGTGFRLVQEQSGEIRHGAGKTW